MPTLLLFSFDFTTIDWKVILAAVSLMVALVALVYFQWWRNRKRFSYEILSDVVLVSAEKEIRDKLEIRFEGQPVKNVQLLVIKLINDGYVPIKRDDFEKEVKFQFPRAKILTAEKIHFNPENIGTQLSYRDDWLTIDPVLFNRKDYIKFKLLLSDYTGMTIDARIVGITKIGRLKTRLYQTRILQALAVLATLTFISFFESSIIKAIAAVVLTAIVLAIEYPSSSQTREF